MLTAYTDRQKYPDPDFPWMLFGHIVHESGIMVVLSSLRNQEICSLASGSGGYACTQGLPNSVSAGDMLLATGSSNSNVAHGHTCTDVCVFWNKRDRCLGL